MIILTISLYYAGSFNFRVQDFFVLLKRKIIKDEKYWYVKTLESISKVKIRWLSDLCDMIKIQSNWFFLFFGVFLHLWEQQT